MGQEGGGEKKKKGKKTKTSRKKNDTVNVKKGWPSLPQWEHAALRAGGFYVQGPGSSNKLKPPNTMGGEGGVQSPSLGGFPSLNAFFFLYFFLIFFF